ncbi:MAG: leucyl aminopeptidase family protein, partial [Planctomycetes bacterium]|nr:leucyl aminopeptidase family protein [Planctomycetota bacterium]
MTRLVAVKSPESAAAQSGGFDAVVLVGHQPTAVKLAPLTTALHALAAADAQADQRVNLIAAPAVSGGRLVIAPTGPVLRDYDDVRRYAEAASAGVQRARDAGAKSVLLLVQTPPLDVRYGHAAVIAALGAVGGLWQPLEAREALGERAVEPVQKIGVAVLGGEFSPAAAKWVDAVDAGVRLARDLCGTEPERMAPPKFAATVQAACRGTAIKVSVDKDVA